MAYGITPQGFNLKRLEDIRLELIEQLQAELGSIDTSPESVLGVLVGIIAKGLADLWEGQESTYNSLYPSTADGISLDNVADFTGVRRLAATKTTGIIQCFGDIGTPISAGLVVSIENVGDRFEILDNVVISPAVGTTSGLIDVDTVIDSTDYIVTINGTASTFNSGVGATALSIAAGLVAQVDLSPEAVVGIDNLDGTFFVQSTDPETPFTLIVSAELVITKAAVNTSVQAEEFGAVQGLAGTATVIETPLSGWDSVTNGTDFDIGREPETDTELRLRRLSSLQVTGAGTLEAIRSRLLQVVGVTAAFVEENTTTAIDGAGRPPKSFEAVVAGGDDQDIADLLWLVKPAGIETFGTEMISVVDSQGISHDIYFSRATEIYLHLRITLTLSPEETFPVDGSDQVALNALEYGQTLQIGDDVYVQRFFVPVYEVIGIADATIEIATSALPGDPPGAWQTTNLAISNTEVAVFDSGRITVLIP